MTWRAKRATYGNHDTGRIDIPKGETVQTDSHQGTADFVRFHWRRYDLWLDNSRFRADFEPQP